MDSGSSRLHVVPSLSGGWVVRETADGPSLRRTNTRRGALTFATDVLFRGCGGEIQLHEEDGTVAETYDVSPRGKRPWWYSPPRIVFLVTGILFVGQGAFNLWASSRFMFWLGCVLVVTGTLQVVSFLISKRSDRAFKLAPNAAVRPEQTVNEG